MDILYFPLHSYTKCEAEGFRTRDAHILKELESSEKVGKILMVDRPVSLPEFLIKKRSFRPATGTLVWKRGNASLTKVSEKLHVLDSFSWDILNPLTDLYGWWSRRIASESSLESIRTARDTLKMENSILFLSTPFCSGVIGKLGESFLLFDAIDNLLKHTYLSRQQGDIRERYEEIKRKADIITAVSEPLTAFLREGREDVHCIRNGADPGYFNLGETIPKPDGLLKLPSPVIGYSGKINKRLDVELVSFLAGNLPEASFVFVGQMMDSGCFKPLRKHKNVHWLGDKHYGSLPAYIAAFDVCIVPHSVGANEIDGDLMKLYEYAASGKPVLSTPVVGIGSFADRVAVAEGKEKFLEKLRSFLAIPSDERQKLEKERREAFPLEWTWKNRTENILALVLGKIEQTGTKVQS